jgi:hypothetical protein
MCIFSDNRGVIIRITKAGWHIADTASSIRGTVTSIGAVAVGTLIGQSFDETTVPLATGNFGIGIAVLGIVYVVEGGDCSIHIWKHRRVRMNWLAADLSGPQRVAGLQYSCVHKIIRYRGTAPPILAMPVPLSTRIP